MDFEIKSSSSMFRLSFKGESPSSIMPIIYSAVIVCTCLENWICFARKLITSYLIVIRFPLQLSNKILFLRFVKMSAPLVESEVSCVTDKYLTFALMLLMSVIATGRQISLLDGFGPRSSCLKFFSVFFSFLF